VCCFSWKRLGVTKPCSDTGADRDHRSRHLPLLPIGPVILAAIGWALALGVLFTPLHRWIESKLKRPNLAATVTILVVGLIVVVPATFVGQRLIMESARGAENIKTKVESGEWRRAIQAQPRLAHVIDWIKRKVDLPGTIKDIATWLTATAGSILKGSVLQMIGWRNQGGDQTAGHGI